MPPAPQGEEHHQPLTSAPAEAPVGDGARWTTGEFDGVDECLPTFVMAWFCPCFLVAQIAGRIHMFKNKSSTDAYWIVVCFYGICYLLSVVFLGLSGSGFIFTFLFWLLSIVMALFSYLVRNTLTTKQGIRSPNCYTGRAIPAQLCDFCYHVTYTSCSLTQMSRHVGIHNHMNGRCDIKEAFSPPSNDPAFVDL